jgi:hypothetical protein
MANEEKQKPNAPAKKPRATLRDLTASKNVHVIGGRGGKPHAKLRDLTVPKKL